MIPNINKTDRIEGALDYNERKIKKGNVSILWSSNIDYNTACGITKEDIHNAFTERLEVNRRTKKPIVTISLNVHPKDVPDMDDYRWQNIAEDYLKEMGYEHQPYVIYKHNDIQREHIHIITTDIGTNGKKVVNDHFYKIKSETARRMVEQKYGLTSADISKEEKKKNETIRPPKIDINNSVAKQIKDVVRFAKTYKYGTLGEFTALLETFNVGNSIEYNDKKEVSGLLFFPINDNGYRIGKSIKASFLGSKFNHTAILKNATADDKIKKIRNAKTKERVEPSIKKLFEDIKSGKNAKEAYNIFKQEIQAQDISIVFRNNDKNKIYGVTFIDNRGKNIVNGSKLGKLFSANSFNEALNKDVLSIEKGNRGKLLQTITNTPTKTQFIEDNLPITDNETQQAQPLGTDELLDIWNKVYSGDYFKELFSTTGHIQQNSTLDKENLPEWMRKKRKKKSKKIYRANI